jgi:hypothetical protein
MNNSFEEPGDRKHLNLDGVPGWISDWTTNLGVEQTIFETAYDGDWVAYVKNEGLFRQTLDEKIQPGTYTLKYFAQVSWANNSDDSVYAGSAFYALIGEDRERIDSQRVYLPTEGWSGGYISYWEEVVHRWTAEPGRFYSGQSLGIEFGNVTDPIPASSTWMEIDYVTLVHEGSTGVDQKETCPEDMALGQNYPNPFNPSTTIVYALKACARVKLSVVDLTGRERAVLTDAFQGAGIHKVRFDAPNLASGVYFYRLETAGRVIVKKMTRLQ